MMDFEKLVEDRKAFIETCSPATQDIHRPIADPRIMKGCLNPNGLGDAAKYSTGSGLAWGQSTIAFLDAESFEIADAGGDGYDGSAEYGIVRTADSAAVCRKMAELHGGAGAVFLSSGLAAVTVAFMSFPKDRHSTILMPESHYFPSSRMLRERLSLDIKSYSSNADGAVLEKIIGELKAVGKMPGLLYMEAPGSHTFDIPDFEGLVAVARAHGIKTVIDNTWANHVRFRPLEHGIDIAIQATTKYESGYGDTPSGVVIAASSEDYDTLFHTTKFLGLGSVDLPTCRRLLGRIGSTEERMDRHYASALKVIAWFQAQDFTQEIICPFIESSPDYERFKTYFKKGNGLFTVVFREDISADKVKNFMTACPLILNGQSWGGHVTLAMRCDPKREFTYVPPGEKVRYSMGLEDPDDIIRSLGAVQDILE